MINYPASPTWSADGGGGRVGGSIVVVAAQNISTMGQLKRKIYLAPSVPA